MVREVVIVDAVRTPIGKINGVLKNVRAADLAAVTIEAIMERNPLVLPEEIEDVVLGNANQSGEYNRNVARMATLLAGLPQTVGGTTINRLGGSGLDAVTYAARGILANEGDIYIAGGTESMTRAAYVMAKPGDTHVREDKEMFDTTFEWRFKNNRIEKMDEAESLLQTAENVADQFGVTREEQDVFAYESQMCAKRALESHAFFDEIVPVTYTDIDGNLVTVTEDEHPQTDTLFEKLQELQPMIDGGTVTEGNASVMNDGASVLLLMSAEKARELNVKPLAKYVTSAVSGLEPSIMGLGPIYAVRKVLQRANMSLDEMDLIELNEAFASQAVKCIRHLEFDKEKVNVNGGAIALGDPLGASGARILTSLLHEMNERDATYGLATMCIGDGQGIATIVEKVD